MRGSSLVLLVLLTLPSAAAISTILLDASNLQYSLRPGLSELALCSADIPNL